MRCALVTGTSRGLGHATAKTLLGRGWRVVGISRTEPEPGLESADYEHVRLDLSDLEALRSWLAEPEPLGRLVGRCERFGLVNNAGLLSPMAPTRDLASAALRTAYAVNALAPTLLMGYAARVGAGRAVRIVNISSGAASSAYPGWSAYCSTKAALRMAGEVLAVECDESPELAEHDLAVVSYAPGIVDTRMQDEIRAVRREDFPRREKFEQLHAEGALVAAERPAAEIARLLEEDGAPAHRELRYGAS